MNDLVRIEMRFGQARQLSGSGKTSGEHPEDGPALQQQAASGRQLFAEQMYRPQRDRHIQQAEQQAGAHHAKIRRQDQREENGDSQCAEIVEREHLRHQILEGQFALQDAHDERDLQADQHANPEHHQIEHQLEWRRQPDKNHEQADCRKATEQTNHQFDLDKTTNQVARDVFRQPRPGAHREQVGADHRRELHHRIAQQVGRQRPGDQFVSQAAGGDDEDGKEEGMTHGQRCYPEIRGTAQWPCCPNGIVPPCLPPCSVC